MLMSRVGLAMSAETTETPAFSSEFVGSAEQVFDTRTQACAPDDIPDANPRAFRDSSNNVHLIATHYVARAMVGPTLDSVKHDCHIIYKSQEDPDPSHFEDRNWLMSFYTEDGSKIIALVHSEYEAATFAGKCTVPLSDKALRNSCWWNTITYALSDNDGFLFTMPAPPRNLVASVPYQYDTTNRAGAYGYNTPTNILKIGAYYYSMVNTWPYRAQKYGSCLIRSDNPFDPKSWRGWDGNSFTVIFVNPYDHLVTDPGDHVCEPVVLGETTSLVIHEQTKIIIATQNTPDGRFGPRGLYFMFSTDLIHWSKPVIVASMEHLAQMDGSYDWDYGYFSILDPTAIDRNFSTISDHPYVYYVRTDRRLDSSTRTLFRRRFDLQLGVPH